jgi:hypothetical protein
MNPEEESGEIGDPEIKDAVLTLMQDLPKPVREFLLSNERAAVARDLSSKYRLHADQAGEFEQAYLHMLLGIASPEDFVTALKKTGLDTETINGLAADVNERVFMRLRDAEREAAVPQAPTQKPAPLPPPALDYPAPAAPTLPGSPVAAPMPAASEPTATPAPILEATPAPQPIVPQQHFVHSMPNAQPQSGWHPAAAVHIFVPTHGAPQHQAPQQGQHPVSPAPEPAPYVPATPLESRMPISMPAMPIQQPAPPSAPATPLKKDYAADPYREPIQ